MKRPYVGSITGEPFMFYEMKITAELLNSGLSEEEVLEEIISQNLYQYPTERSLKRRGKACLRRLKYLDNELLSWLNTRPIDAAKQTCLYAFMKESKLISDFMITVIGEKYETKDFSYSRNDINKFFIRLQEQNTQVASWSELTIKKISSVIVSLLKENKYIEKSTSKKLNEFLIDYKLKGKIIENGDGYMLPAFNCFEV